MFISKTRDLPPAGAERRRRRARAAAAGRDGAGADARGADRGAAAAPCRLRLHPARRHHARVDAGRRGRGIRVHADSQAARAVSEFARRRQQSEPRRSEQQPCRVVGVLADRRPAEADRRSRFPRRRIRRSGHREADWTGHDLPVAGGRDRGFHRAGRRVRSGLQLRVHEHAQLADADDAAADGDQSTHRVRAVVRKRRHGRGSSGADAHRSQPPRLRGRRSQAARGRCRRRRSDEARRVPRLRA